MKPTRTILIAAALIGQCTLGSCYLRNGAGQEESANVGLMATNAEPTSRAFQNLIDKNIFHVVDKNVPVPSDTRRRDPNSRRRLSTNCDDTTGDNATVQVECVAESTVQEVIEFSVFHDARHVETVYTDPANPSDTAIGNVIVYNNADLLNAGDMGTVQGSVQGTCTIVSTTSASHYCSLSYQIFDGDSASVSFAAEGRVNNNDITGSTLTISGGFNGIEKFAGTAVLTPAYLDESIDPPLAVPDGRVFDGYLIKFQVQSNYAVVSTRTRSPSPAPSGV